MKKSLVSEITIEQYHQLCGLLLITQRANLTLKECERAALSITKEVNEAGEPSHPYDGGHTGDAVYSDAPNVDDLLRKLSIVVAPYGQDPAPPTKVE